MTSSTVMTLAYQGMRVTLLIGGPLLGTALLVGLVVSLFQAATQINEMTLSFIPKILAIMLTLAVAGPYLLTVIQHYTVSLFQQIPGLIG